MPLECENLSSAKSSFVRASRRSKYARLAIISFAAWWQAAGAFAALAADGAPDTAVTNSVIHNPIVPTFRVQGYAVGGNTVLSQETIDRVMREATGNQVSIPQIRRALLRLQEAYRVRGYTKVAVTLPRQSLTDGTARMQVIEDPEVASSLPPISEPPTPVVPTYDVRHFEIHGNTALEAEELDRILSPAAGVVSEEQLKKALSKLQDVYRDRGYSDATVTLPQQLLTYGMVVLDIKQGPSPSDLAAATKTNPAPVPATPPPVRTFEIRHYEVVGNTLLRQDTIDSILAQATGTNVTLQQIQKAKAALLTAYRERGFASVSVITPPQQITNATIRLEVLEGRLVNVRVTGNHYFSSNNVMHALPTLQEALIWKDKVVNSRVLQRELDIANGNRDRTIYPVISPGPDPGTSAIELRVKDRLPVHGRLELNNYSTPGTPDWRINASANYNNLWQREHQFGLSYGFTPEAFKSAGLMPDYFFNRPLISYYGAYYRLPFGSAESVTDRINSSAQFGYDEATHQVRLPPAGARPDLTFYASGSSTDTGVKLGPLTEITPSGSNPFITSQDSGQNLSINESAGGRLNVPLVLSDTKRFGFSGGADWKRYVLESFNTNNFTFVYRFHDPNLGDQLIVTESHSPQPSRRNEVSYLPLALGADYFETDAHGTFTANLGLSYNFIGDSDEFKTLTYSRDASADFGKMVFAFTRDQKIFKDWSLLLRASGQVATGPLINTEQFALGGINSVRGYYEGDEYGDDGWFGSVELRTPYLATSVAGWTDTWPVWLRASVFVDGGQRFFLDAPAGVDPYRSLLGAGFGLSANINNHLDLRITVGWPLRDSVNTRAGDPRAYFSLGGQF